MNCLIDHPEIVCTVAFIKEAKVSVSHNPLFFKWSHQLTLRSRKKRGDWYFFFLGCNHKLLAIQMAYYNFEKWFHLEMTPMTCDDYLKLSWSIKSLFIGRIKISFCFLMPSYVDHTSNIFENNLYIF